MLYSLPRPFICRVKIFNFLFLIVVETQSNLFCDSQSDKEKCIRKSDLTIKIKIIGKVL